MDGNNQEKTQYKILMRKAFLLFIFIFIIGALYAGIKFVAEFRSADDFSNVKIGDAIIRVMIADDVQEQRQGLSDKATLSKDEGMLFVFGTKQVRSFWMKRMNFPIDIIWIDGNRVVKIDKNLQPEGDDPKLHYASELEIDHVLEVNAGIADEQKINVGDVVQYNLIKK